MSNNFGKKKQKSQGLKHFYTHFQTDEGKYLQHFNKVFIFVVIKHISERLAE